MPEPTQVAADVDARLAEIDRRLSEIQAELLPEREPRRSREPGPSRAPGPSPEAVTGGSMPPVAVGSGSLTDLAAMSEPQMRLLSSIRELLEAYQWLLARMRPEEATEGGPGGGELAVSVGPFASID